MLCNSDYLSAILVPFLWPLLLHTQEPSSYLTESEGAGERNQKSVNQKSFIPFLLTRHIYFQNILMKCNSIENEVLIITSITMAQLQAPAGPQRVMVNKDWICIGLDTVYSQVRHTLHYVRHVTDVTQDRNGWNTSTFLQARTHSTQVCHVMNVTQGYSTSTQVT